MKIYKRPILAFFYCETSRLVSITNDRQERKFKIHRSVENSKRWKSDPKKSISWQNFYFWFPSEPSPRSPNAANLKGFLFQSGVHLKDATNQWLLWSLPAAGKKSKQSLSDPRSDPMPSWYHMKETLESAANREKFSIGEMVLLAWIDKDDLVEMD